MAQPSGKAAVNAASLVDLKAELARKQAEFQEERLNPELRDLRMQVRRGLEGAGHAEVA